MLGIGRVGVFSKFLCNLCWVPWGMLFALWVFVVGSLFRAMKGSKGQLSIVGFSRDQLIYFSEVISQYDTL